MRDPSDHKIRAPRYAENSALFIVGALTVAALYYQLPRWATGLDPMFVHPSWVEQSPLPFLYDLAAVHPLVWTAVLALVCVRIFKNYGWRV